MSKQTELTDRDLSRIRLRFLDLLKSFFQDEPDAELLSRWRGIFAALEGQPITRNLDATTHDLAELLANMTLQDIKKEHYSLFVDPYSKQLLPLTAAYYIDGKSFGPSLARYRDILKEGQVIKEQEVTDPEDSLPIMLDVLIALVQEEKQGESKTKHLQDQLLQEFLIPTVKAIAKDIGKNADILFYIKCVAFLEAYLELEEGLFET
jgi:TorA maturation chaperone TorD